jgi:hypothetical protein
MEGDHSQKGNVSQLSRHLYNSGSISPPLLFASLLYKI